MTLFPRFSVKALLASRPRTERRKTRTSLVLESLEGRQVMSGTIATLPVPVLVPTQVQPGSPNADVSLRSRSLPISVPGGKVISSFSVTVGSRIVVVAQVQVPGATGNNMRIYAGVTQASTGAIIRSNILISDGSNFGNHYLPDAVATTAGKVVVGWTHVGLGNSNRILYRMIDPNAATTITAVRQASSTVYTTKGLGYATTRALPNGAFTIRWADFTSRKVFAADFSSNGIMTRREYFYSYMSR